MPEDRYRWITQTSSCLPPLAQVFFFPHGGGRAEEYLRLFGSDHQTSHALNLPGRAGLGPDYETFSELENDLRPPTQQTDLPTIFFGHSLGSLIAYEAACAWPKNSRSLLVVSGMPVPEQIRQDTNFTGLDDVEVIRRVASMHGGIPQFVSATPQDFGISASALRADYGLLNSYQIRRRARLPMDALALFGTTDMGTMSDGVHGWSEKVSGNFYALPFDGGHFFLRNYHRTIRRKLLMWARSVQQPS